MSSTTSQLVANRGSSHRPSTIAELAQRARDNLCDENQDLKFYLRVAEKYRRTGREFVDAGDLESGFVEYAKAATLVLERLPKHRDYTSLLSPSQRQNLALNGQDILDSLSALKPKLVERHERWLAQHPNGVEPESEATQPRIRSNSYGGKTEPDSRQRQDDARLRVQDDVRVRERLKEQIRHRESQERRLAGERELWKLQGEEHRRRADEDRERARGAGLSPDPNTEARRRAAVAAARHAANTVQPSPSRDPNYSASRRNDYDGLSAPHPIEFRRSEDSSQLDYRQSQHQRQQEEMRRRGEDITRRRIEERRRQEQDGIARRQQEAEEEAQSVRHNIDVNNAGSSSTSLAAQNMMTPPQVRAPRAVSSRPSSTILDQYPTSDALLMPLESPTRFEDDTDTEAVVRPGGKEAPRFRTRQDQHRRQAAEAPYSRAPPRSPSYPPPITTTSPPPPDGPIRYPEIMSLHQKHQGYVPSLQSMFNPVLRPLNGSLLFDYGSSSSHFPPGLPAQQSASHLYPYNMLPQPSVPVNSQPGYPYGGTSQHPYQQPQQSAYPTPQPNYRNYPPPSLPPPAKPAPSPRPAAAPIVPQRTESSRIARESSSEPPPKELKPVSLPRESLQRFLSIASLNTSQNKETCGLLLGKDKGHKFVVTTLLIPKQHSTSDTCTMDEEELVLQFTEERSLITLGWIHTHPSQSCFMSSVDLHTHSGFQRMLPESFAVVCAPKSTPNFGIFRLTDPPGLHTILTCSAKEAFHPHPDVPIYTDADKGHVTMKDISLEIVDLR